MFWFRMAFGFNLLAAFAWDIGVCAGILAMCSQGAKLQSIEQDPTKNGTVSVYVFILVFQFLLAFSAIFAFIICFRIWRNQFQLDKQLRSHFIIWFVSWVIALLGILSVAIYAFVRSRDPQGQIGLMYEMFQMNAQQQQFVAGMERFQREHSCCGIYGPDDWLMVQLQQQPGASAFQALDLGTQMNPSTGKCHLLPPTIPIGCGKVLMFVVNRVVRMYAALTTFQLVLGIAAGILAWYCFFYWLEEEVMILPTDELCEIIVVEPPDQSVIELDEEGQDQFGYDEEFYEPGQRYFGNYGGGRNSGAGRRKTYLHSFVGPDGKQRSYIVPGEFPGSRTRGGGGNTHRDIAPSRRSQPRARSSLPRHENRIPTQMYLTRSQFEAEGHRLERNESPMSRRNHRRVSVESRNPRIDDYEGAFEHHRRPPPLQLPRHERPTNRRRILPETNWDHYGEPPLLPEEDDEDVSSRNSRRRGHPPRRRLSTRSRRNSREHLDDSVDSIEPSIESVRSRASGAGHRSGSRPRTSPPRRDHMTSITSQRRPTIREHDIEQDHNNDHDRDRAAGSRSRNRSRAVEAKILYKNHNAVDRTDST